MSKVDKLLKERIANNPERIAFVENEQTKLDAAVALLEVRESLGLTQRELAEKVGKPQSTIARIENGTMNVSFKIMREIAESLGKRLEIHFV